MCYNGRSVTLFRLLFLVVFAGPWAAAASDLNALILRQIDGMPQAGGYSTSRYAKIKLQSAAHFESGKFFILPKAASPSYCSGATYLVFIQTLETLREQGRLHLPHATLEQLIIRDQADGEGIWGRWNANGPGTARLFHELKLGRNFSSYEAARPGDFMKIFWSREVGRRESGHSVIYLGQFEENGVPMVRYWSSNQPSGYGAVSVPRRKIAQVVFSRLETPGNLTRIHDVPASDRYLASLLRVRSSFAEIRRRCGF